MTTWEAIVAETSQPHEPRASCSETLGSFCANLRYAALPAAAIERVKHFFIDYLAIALRASTLDSSQPVRALSRAYPIPGQATLLGRPDPVSPHWAALANGQAAHSMELDDTFLEGSMHTESSVFSACMALAEEHGLGGQRFVEAAVAGFEVACRVSRALQPAVTNARGFHPTGTCGALGAAGAAGKLLGLTRTRWRWPSASPAARRAACWNMSRTVRGRNASTPAGQRTRGLSPRGLPSTG